MQVLVDTMLIVIQAQLISEIIGSEFNWQDLKNGASFQGNNLRL